MGSRTFPVWTSLFAAVLACGCNGPGAPTAKPTTPKHKNGTAPTAGPSLETLITRASSVQLAKVIEVEDVDDRPSDGNHNRRFTLEVLRSSGTSVHTLYVPIAYGGMRPAGPPPQLPKQLRSDSLRLGEKHWFLIGSDADPASYPYPIVAWWPEEKAPRQITNLVSQDTFHWRPIYHAGSGLTYGYQVLSPTRWKVIVKRDGDSVWEHEIDGAVASTNGKNEMNIYAGAQYQMDPINPPDAKHGTFLIYPVTRVTLGDGNRFDVPPGEYRVRYGRELASNKLLAEWVLPLNYPNDPLALRQFNSSDGKLMLSARIEHLASGGVAVGSENESWLRKIVKRYNADGLITSTDLFRHGSVKDENGQHSHHGWVRIEPKTKG